ncbi:MAG: nuclear transport factor 2 family protein [Solirubrobacterales bacterium]
MSEENEIVRKLIEAFNRRDAEALQALLAPDAEIVPMRAALEDTVYRGPDAASQWYAALDQSWEGLTVEVEEIRDVAQGVLAIGRIRGRGRESGAGIDVEAASLVRFRDGLVTRLRTYSDVAQALEAAGLSE